MRLRPNALMEWERGRSPWSRTALQARRCAAAPDDREAVLEQDVRSRHAPLRHQGVWRPFARNLPRELEHLDAQLLRTLSRLAGPESDTGAVGGDRRRYRRARRRLRALLLCANPDRSGVQSAGIRREHGKSTDRYGQPGSRRRPPSGWTHRKRHACANASMSARRYRYDLRAASTMGGRSFDSTQRLQRIAQSAISLPAGRPIGRPSSFWNHALYPPHSRRA